ncbi:hypothetical protein E2E30_03415 [Sphingomonas sp. AAP5]|uniref:hypothetical protein n=1 Tax=Sphingomonas sp. AAP5 TaxID=1523415 RepID=UPI0010575070|nr:hypothetical protein [Sphingomonas sp. AAP5]QBM74914.1 hypothetical protein E2E30_03415 [Sphingomonas sp. AAP5]
MVYGDHDYITFREALLIAVADEQEPPGLGAVQLEQVAERHAITYQATWMQMVGPDFERLQYGKMIFDGETRFLIRGAGVEAATLFRRERAPKTIASRIAAVSRSDWIAVCAAIISLIALLKSK